MSGGRLPVAYVVPIRWVDDDDVDDLTGYLATLSTLVDVVVVDGSPEPLFGRHAELWSAFAVHVPPRSFGYLNGKVNGVTTGVLLAGWEKVILADDDVRYDLPGLWRTAGLLDAADLVRPQNYFDPCPWHARWDTARTLINRAVAVDYPGTFGLRRSRFLAMGGYDGGVLFENLELARTVAAAGGREVAPPDLYVARRPPSVRRFWSQRVRQAYDEFAQPLRLAFFLAVLPAVGAAGCRRRPRVLLAGALGSVAVAEAGRRRSGGTAVFPRSAVFFAPLWLAERGVCSWLAGWLRCVRGGVPYAGRRLNVAAHSRRRIAERLRSAPPGRVVFRAAGGPEAGRVVVGAAGGPEAGRAVAAVAERLECRPAAPAERDRPPARVDPGSVLVEEPEVAADDQRAVGVRGDGRPAVGAHGRPYPRPVGTETL